MRPLNVSVKYDGITAAGLDAQDEREAIYRRDGGICQACKKPVAFGEFEVAHRIANTKANRRRWGAEVLDSPLNKATTHRGRCNAKMNIGGNPGACAELVDRINCRN